MTSRRCICSVSYVIYCNKFTWWACNLGIQTDIFGFKTKRYLWFEKYLIVLLKSFFGLLFLSVLACVCWQFFVFHVFLSPSTKWRRHLPYVYNPVGFPSSKPAISPNYYYFFTAEGTFHTLHYRSSTIHVSPSPFHCVQHPLPFPITQRWLTLPDTIAGPWHGFLRHFVNAISFRKPACEERYKHVSTVWVGATSQGVRCHAFQGQALNAMECSILSLLAPSQ